MAFTKRDIAVIEKILTLAKDHYYNKGSFFKVPVEKLSADVAEALAFGKLVRGDIELPDVVKVVKAKTIEVTDARYDVLEALLKELSPKSTLVAQTRSPVGVKQVEVKLPYLMPSLDKKYYGDGTLAKWAAKFPGPYIISDKLDGVSMELLSHNGKFDQLYKGGSATHGMDWSHAIPHLKLPKKAPAGAETGVRAEIIMSKKEFDAKWSKEKGTGKYQNSRNLTSGIVNKTRGFHEAIGSVEPLVFDVLHKRMKPSDALKWAEQNGFKTAHYIVAKTLNEEQVLKYLRTREKADHLIDGLVIAQDKPYALTEANPKSMIAFKAPSAGNYAETTITEIEWRPSRHGMIVPRFTVTPVKLSGVTVTHAAAHNAKYVVDNKLNVGSVVGIVRSGEVIPYVQDVIKPSKTASLPDKSVVGDYGWDANKTHFVLAKQGGNSSSKVKAIAHFFQEGLEVDDMGVGVVQQLYDAGYDTVRKIIKLTPAELVALPGWQSRKAEKIRGNIDKACKSADLIKVMAGSGVLGPLLGERKLTALFKARPKLFDMNITHTEAELTSQLQDVPGFKDKSAAPIIANLAKCFKWIQTLPITFKKAAVLKVVGNKFAGQQIVFTGVRSEAAETAIKQQGGNIGSGVTSKTSILVCKDPNSGSSKLVKAQSLGVKIMSLQQLNQSLGI